MADPSLSHRSLSHPPLTHPEAPVSASVLPEGFDLTDPAVLEQRVPHEELLHLRQNAPVCWVDQVP